MSSDLKQTKTQSEKPPKPTVTGICTGRLGFEIFLALAVFVGAEHCLRGETSVLELLLVYLYIICDKCLLKLHNFYQLCTKL